MHMPIQTADIPSLPYSALVEHIRLSKVNPGLYEGLEELLKLELAQRNPTRDYKCLKCGHEKFEMGEIRTSRSFLSSFFNVQSARYSAVVCSRCAFTEFYQGQVSAGEQAMDFVFGS